MSDNQLILKIIFVCNLPDILWHNVLMAQTATMATAEKLNEYLQDWLGTPAESEQKMVHLIEGGLPTKVINHLIERGLTRKEVFEVIIPLRTWKHRKSRRQPLSKEESERAVRTARVLARAQAVWGDEESALSWLRAPKERFEGRSPLQMLSTETGGRLVEQMLVQIDEGMFA
jgi:putative toxin-antitoxin system antitoxin component (TIGR02293 family)